MGVLLRVFGCLSPGERVSLSGCAGVSVRVFGCLTPGVWVSHSGCAGVSVRVYGCLTPGMRVSLSGCMGVSLRVCGCLGPSVRVSDSGCAGDSLQKDKRHVDAVYGNGQSNQVYRQEKLLITVDKGMGPFGASLSCSPDSSMTGKHKIKLNK
jgi:hypothetical protein